MRTRGDRDVYPIATHTITPEPGLKSEEMISRHSCSRCVVDHTIEDAPEDVKGSRSHGLRTESPCCSKFLRTLQADNVLKTTPDARRFGLPS
ncbi:hypothetical protein TNCV_1909371 [Trichonephila clavipes]|nr:hypothetical protein TNCV_1909371 [Trichonephila clavipes]